MKKVNFFTTTLNFAIAALFYISWGKITNTIADNALIYTNANTIGYARVTIKNSTFNPYELFIVEAGTVVWLNADNSIHTVTANDGSFDSGDISAGGNFIFTFRTRGLYAYHCKYHPEMAGAVRVMVK